MQVILLGRKPKTKNQGSTQINCRSSRNNQHNHYVISFGDNLKIQLMCRVAFFSGVGFKTDYCFDAAGEFIYGLYNYIDWSVITG